jgi:hypothetical protein
MLWEPPTVRQTTRLLRSQSSRQANSFGQTDTALRAQAVFIHCSSWSAVCTPTQAPANQHPQLQLHLQLARTQPSGNRIKMRASNRLASVQSVPASSLAALLSARDHHGSSPHLRWQQLYAPQTVDPTCVRLTHHAARSNTTHCSPSTLPCMHRALPADSLLSRPKKRLSVSLPISPLPCEFSPASPVRIHRTVTKEDAATKRPFSGPQHPSPKSGPFQGHIAGILQWRAPFGFPGCSDIITVANICYSNTRVSPWITTSHNVYYVMPAEKNSQKNFKMFL